MNESQQLRIGNWIAGTVATVTLVGGGIFGYGALQAQVTTLEHRADSQSADIRANETQLAASHTDVEVIKSEYADIKARLDEIDAKLDDDKR